MAVKCGQIDCRMLSTRVVAVKCGQIDCRMLITRVVAVKCGQNVDHTCHGGQVWSD